MIEEAICDARCKSTQDKLLRLEEKQGMKDEEQERTISSVTRTTGQIFGKMKTMEKKIDETNERVTKLEKRLPIIIENGIKNALVAGVGKTVIFAVKTILVVGVIGGAAIAVRYWIYGG